MALVLCIYTHTFIITDVNWAVDHRPFHNVVITGVLVSVKAKKMQETGISAGLERAVPSKIKDRLLSQVFMRI